MQELREYCFPKSLSKLPDGRGARWSPVLTAIRVPFPVLDVASPGSCLTPHPRLFPPPLTHCPSSLSCRVLCPSWSHIWHAPQGSHARSRMLLPLPSLSQRGFPLTPWPNSVFWLWPMFFPLTALTKNLCSYLLHICFSHKTVNPQRRQSQVCLEHT